MNDTIWNPKNRFDPTRELGTYGNPIIPENNEFNEFYLKPRNLCYNYIAIYLGNVKKFTVAYTKNKYYINFIYKNSRITFDGMMFDWYQWASLKEVLDKMKEDGIFDENVQKALCTLDTTTIIEAIVKKLIQTGVQVDLSLDWYKGTKWEEHFV